MNFDSYIVSETETAISLPLASPPPPYACNVLGKFNSKKNRLTKAFTLAETLITLTIIGIIAAMTVPTLISKYQKHAYVVGLKKAYASLCNVMKMLPLNEGCSSGDFDCLGWNSETEGEDFNEMRTKLISQQFKINKFCGRDNINDCIKFYLPEEKAPSVGGAFVTDDGMIFHSTYGALVDTAMIMMVDVNGDKGPNVAGRDIFAFEIVGKEFDGIPAGTVMPTGSELRTRYGKAGGSVSSTTGWRNTDGCPNNLPTSYTKALNCTGRVLEEDAMNY